MKKILTILLVLVMVFSIGSISLASEVSDSNEQVQSSDKVTAAESAEQLSEDETLTTGITSEESGEPEKQEDDYLIAKIISVSEIESEHIENEDYGNYTQNKQTVTLKILNGIEHKDLQVDSENLISVTFDDEKNSSYNYQGTEYKKGQKVYVAVTDSEEEGEQPTVQILKVKQDSLIWICAIILAVALLVISLKSGIKTIAVILANTIITMLSFIVFCFIKIPAIVLLLAISLVIIVSNVLIIKKPSKETWVTILAIVLSTIITFGALYVLTSITGLKDSNIFDYSENSEAIQQIKYSYGIEPNLLGIKYIDVLNSIMIIASLGVTIDVALRTVKKSKIGGGFRNTIKEAAQKLPNKLNSVYLVLIGILLLNFVQAKIYADQLLFVFNQDSILIEVIKILIVLLNPIIVIPISALLSKEMLEPNKTIDEPKEK